MTFELRGARRPFVLGALTLAFGLASPARGQQAPPADMVLTVGVVYTADAAQPGARAVVVRHGRVLFVGRTTEVLMTIVGGRVVHERGEGGKPKTDA